MKSKLIWALAAAVLAVSVAVANVTATPAKGLVTTILAKATIGDLNLSGYAKSSAPEASRPGGVWLALIRTLGLSDVYVVDNKIPPGGDTGWHSHPGPSLVFVVAGTVTNYASDDRSCAPQVYAAGSSFVDSGGGDVHMIRNESAQPAETIAVQFIPSTASRRTEAPAPANCPAF
jgi:quercetin dioxygenase-like cupin family protein